VIAEIFRASVTRANAAEELQDRLLVRREDTSRQHPATLFSHWRETIPLPVA
jgi:hypothetical protein